MKSRERTASFVASLAAAACLVLLGACGGGGGNGATAEGVPVPAGQPGVPPPVGSLTDFGPAALVIGQPDFASDGVAATDARSLQAPAHAVAAPDGTVYVADANNNRVLIYARLPSTNGAAADGVLGQPDFFASAAPGGPARNNLSSPGGVSVGAGKLAVVDVAFHRVLVHNALPAASGALPDVVVGQDDFGGSEFDCAVNRLNFPQSAVITPDGKLVVADSSNHRVLIWNQVPAVHGQAPDRVLGQGRLDTCAANDDDQDGATDAAPSARTLRNPSGVWSDGTRLVVVDSTNSRVLVWNQFPASDFEPADLVLGQSSFVASEGSDDDQDGLSDPHPSARTLSLPFIGVASDGARLAVSDGTNRVMVWNAWPTRNFQPADLVLGQGSFMGSRENDDDQDGFRDPFPTARTLSIPFGLAFHGSRLLVTDSANHRVLVFEAR